MGKTGYSETDLYPPVKAMFEAAGYTVRAEVKGCDMAAVKDGGLLAVEFKLGMSLQLVYQALERKRLADAVYVCVPRPKRADSRNFINAKRLLKALGVGLITVSLDSPLPLAEVVAEPEIGPADGKQPAKRVRLRKEAVIKEISGRTLDLNSGGSSRRKLNTAYRERCLKTACVLEKFGPLPLAEITARAGFETRGILNGNVYGWFERARRGVYALSAAGVEYLKNGEFGVLTQYYRAELESEADNE